MSTTEFLNSFFEGAFQPVIAKAATVKSVPPRVAEFVVVRQNLDNMSVAANANASVQAPPSR